MADNQGRGGAGAPAWDASQQTRIGKAIVGDRPVTNITAGYEIAGDIRWRNVTGNPKEVRSRICQTLAAGGVVHYHWLGFQQGFGEDRRWQKLGREVLGWQAANDRHFHNVRSIANVALVVSQLSNRLYDAPAGTDRARCRTGHVPAADRGAHPVRRDARARPDFGSLGALQAAGAAQHRADERCPGGCSADVRTQRRIDTLDLRNRSVRRDRRAARRLHALAELFGMRRIGKRESYGRGGTPSRPSFPGSSAIQRIERRHPILTGFADTAWIQGSSCRVPIAIDGRPILTHVAQYPWYPTEGVYSREPHTPFATIARTRTGPGPADPSRGRYRGGLLALGRRPIWAISCTTRSTGELRDSQPITVTGDGLLELYGWETEPGYAVHLVNHASPGFRATATRGLCPLGAQEVRMTLPNAKRVTRATLLRSGRALAFRQDGPTIRFTVPGVVDYEVVALET